MILAYVMTGDRGRSFVSFFQGMLLFSSDQKETKDRPLSPVQSAHYFFNKSGSLLL